MHLVKKQRIIEQKHWAKTSRIIFRKISQMREKTEQEHGWSKQKGEEQKEKVCSVMF